VLPGTNGFFSPWCLCWAMKAAVGPGGVLCGAAGPDTGRSLPEGSPLYLIVRQPPTAEHFRLMSALCRGIHMATDINRYCPLSGPTPKDLTDFSWDAGRSRGSAGYRTAELRAVVEESQIAVVVSAGISQRLRVTGPEAGLMDRLGLRRIFPRA
jgi:hypothetical protein